MRNRLPLFPGTFLAAVLMAASGTARAQDVFYVTGVSGDGVAQLEDAAGNRATLGTRGTDVREFEEGVVHVLSDHQLMALSDSGTVVVVLGPAMLVCGRDGGRSRLVLDDGRLLVASPQAGEGRSPLVVSTPADEAGVRAIEAVAAPGRCYFRRAGRQAQVACFADGGTPSAMALKVNGQARSIKNGELLTVVNGQVRVESAAHWLATERFDARWGITLGVASAQTARPELETALFDNIISWDKYGGKGYVTSRLEAGRFRPEIRQVVTTVATPERVAAPGSGVPETTGFPAANEVPLLSPAALSVVNTAEGVTAIQLNAQARGLLTQTGSRGLGFRGLSQLAIPGRFGGGTPTVGPAGLGAPR